MVTYNPKDWIKIILSFHKSSAFKQMLPAFILLAIITGAVAYLEQHYFQNLIPNNLTLFHQLTGFVISLVLVFRINSAYDRWWEGRKLWGSLLNNSRNLCIKLNTFLPKEFVTERKNAVALVGNFAYVLKEHLREKNVTLLPNEISDFNTTEYLKANHKPNYIVNYLTHYLFTKCPRLNVTPNDYLLLSKHLDEFTEICGACERIRSTPIPYSYSTFIKTIIFMYIITLPVSFGVTAGFWSIPIVLIIFYAFASLELISEEIEDPFGYDENDLPTDEIAAKIKVNCEEILLGPAIS